MKWYYNVTPPRFFAICLAVNIFVILLFPPELDSFFRSPLHELKQLVFTPGIIAGYIITTDHPRYRLSKLADWDIGEAIVLFSALVIILFGAYFFALVRQATLLHFLFGVFYLQFIGIVALIVAFRLTFEPFGW